MGIWEQPVETALGPMPRWLLFPWEHPLYGWSDLLLVKPRTCTCIVPWGGARRLIVSTCPDHGIVAYGGVG